MITEEKIKAVQKRLRRGSPGGEIKNEILKDGYTDEEMNKVFVPYKPGMRSWYLVFSIIFFIAGVLLPLCLRYMIWKRKG